MPIVAKLNKTQQEEEPRRRSIMSPGKIRASAPTADLLSATPKSKPLRSLKLV